MSTEATKKLMDYLARRDHSEKELREKLEQKFDSGAVEEALDYAREQNWMPDPAELSQKVASQLNDKNKGHLHIQQYLQQKGLPSVERSDEVELEKGLAVLKMSGSSQWSHEQKVRKLINRGFDHEAIQSVLDTHYARARENEIQ